MTEDPKGPDVAETAGRASSMSSRKLKDIRGWGTMKLAIGVVLVAGAVATGLAGLTGWADRGAGAGIALVFTLTAVVFGFAKDQLADRTLKQAIVAGTCAVLLIILFIGLIWFVRPRPSTIVVLNGDLNIAVLPFALEDADGPVDGGFAVDYADGVTASLESSTKEVLSETGIRPDVRRVGESSPDLSESAQELAASGAALAEESHADFVLAGRISFADGLTIIQPLLFVSSDRVPDAPEFSAWYEGSEPVSFPVDLRDNNASLGSSYRALDAAMVTLIRLGLALEELDAGQHATAVQRLEAIDQDGDFRIVPRELALLFLGNAIGKQACGLGGPCDEAALARAEDAYLRATEGAEGFARGRVGLAEVALQRGQGGNCAPTQIVEDELDRADSQYQAVVDDSAAPMTAAAKALLGQARVDACRAVAGVPGAGGLARSFADSLVAQADTTDDRGIDQLAAEGRSFQAITAFVQGRSAEAIHALEEAIELSSQLDRRALWLGTLGDYRSRPPTCDLEGAEQALVGSSDLYDRLIAAAVDQQRPALERLRAEAERLLADVREGRTCS